MPIAKRNRIINYLHLLCAGGGLYKHLWQSYVRSQVAEYIDLLQLDVARNKKYRMDAEAWEKWQL